MSDGTALLQDEAQEASEHTRGFEYALRNVTLALTRQIDGESNEDIKLGLRIALRTVQSYNGFLSK
jgi:hypothetical protein